MDRIVTLLHEQGKVYEEQGDLASAQTKYTECLEIYSEKGDRYGIATLFSAMAHVKMEQNLDAQAQELYEQSLDIFRSLGNNQGIAFSLYGLGELFFRQNNRAQARSLWTECLSMDMETGIRGSKALNALGELAVLEGDYEEATRLWNMSHAEALKIGDPLRIIDSLEGLLSLAMAQKEYDRAASLIGMCEALLSELNTSVSMRKRQTIEKARAMLRTELGEDLFEEAMGDEQETLL
jgi:tetratricopeptide (TPR) repeat protein